RTPTGSAAEQLRERARVQLDVFVRSRFRSAHQQRMTELRIMPGQIVPADDAPFGKRAQKWGDGPIQAQHRLMEAWAVEHELDAGDSGQRSYERAGLSSACGCHALEPSRAEQRWIDRCRRYQ